MPVNSIFDGVTVSPARDFVADVALATKAGLIFLPCVGRFGALQAMTEKGISPNVIYASDISLYSSIIGYLADPDKKLYDLPMDWGSLEDRNIERFVDGTDDEVGLAAGILLALKYYQIEPTGQYKTNLRRELRSRIRHYRDHIQGRLVSQLQEINGLHYEIKDVWDVAKEFSVAIESDEAFLYVNLPGYRRGYTKMFSSAEERFWNPVLPDKEFDPRSTTPFLESVQECRGLALAYVPHGIDRVPMGYYPIFALPQSNDRTDYIVASKDVEGRYAHQRIDRKKPLQFEIYDDQEITKESVIQFVPVDAATALYYRDLFVHRLGTTIAEFYFLMLIDGRVVSACGINDQHLNHGTSEYISEVFGISRTSQRYARLGKLFMLCLTSSSMQLALMRSRRSMQFRVPKGVQTTSITRHREGKTDRSVMKRVSVEEHPSGYKIIYRADFRDDTWGQCLIKWLEKWGSKSRPGYMPKEDSGMVWA